MKITTHATEWGTLYENISMGFHRIAKYVIIPGVHQPSAPFELCVNKAAWGKLSDKDKKFVEMAAKQVTLESWMRVGAEDAKALKFFKEQGNEIIELSPEVQKATKDMSVKWADEQAAANPWFKKVCESQRAFEALCANASSYRNTRY
jgi:TRAP-type mannitol/chloroaromatic compound transport system substrate-binding protein